MADENTGTPTLDELAERVTALENAAKYNLRYSGEQIDSLLDLITERGFESGTEKETVGSKNPQCVVRLSLSFTATKNTRILVGVRSPVFSNPFNNVCVTLGYNSGHVYAQLTMGPNVTGGTYDAYLPSGDYYIDWLVIGR